MNKQEQRPHSLRWTAGPTFLLIMGLLLMVTGLAYGLPWNTDMHGQPSLAAGEGPRTPPGQTVPVTGVEPPMPSRIRAGRTLTNPVVLTERSIGNGKTLFRIYCTPCHGPQGKGDGPVAGKLTAPPDLRSDDVKKRADGFLYATIRNGGVIMPGYRHALSPRERWDLVNYVRHLQER